MEVEHGAAAKCMRVTILGAGTCVSQLPGISNRYPPAFLVEWRSERVLFECSEGVRFRLEQIGVDYASIAHVAISHAHPDHCALVHFVQSVYVKGIWGGPSFKRQTLDIYCPDQIDTDFREKLWDFHLPELRGGKNYEWPELRFHPMSASDRAVVHIGDATLTAAPAYHGFGKVDALAFRLETPEGVFAYSGDTGRCDGVQTVARGADIFVCEASGRIGDMNVATDYGHLNPHDAGTIARDAGVRTLVLFHSTGLDPDDAILAEVRRAGYTGACNLGKDFAVIA